MRHIQQHVHCQCMHTRYSITKRVQFRRDSNPPARRVAMDHALGTDRSAPPCCPIRACDAEPAPNRPRERPARSGRAKASMAQASRHRRIATFRSSEALGLTVPPSAPRTERQSHG